MEILKKILKDFKLLTIFAKKIHLRYFTKLQIRPWANVEYPKSSK